MSVIWSGVTEQGAVVPVQVTAEGKVVAVSNVPSGNYLQLTGGNLTGDLTLGPNPSSPNISLNAASGSATLAGTIFAGDAANTATGLFAATGNASGASPAITARNYAAGGDLFAGYNNVGAKNVTIKADGSATFSGTVEALNITVDQDVRVNNNFSVIGNPAGNAIEIYSGSLANITTILRADGSATFPGEVVIGARGQKWLITESNGVAMLVQQSLFRQGPKLRDLPKELDLIEAALSEVMKKLQMTPPAGWPV